MNICLFSEQEINKPLDIHDERATHIVNILHKKQNDSFTAGIIGGQSGIAVIKEITDSHILFEFTPQSDGKKLHSLKMIIGFPRPIQLKRLLRDVAALGVEEVHLTGTELGEKSYMQSTVVEKGTASKLLLEGIVQAGGTHIPQLFLHKTLKECLLYCSENADSKKDVLKLALDNVNPSFSLREALLKNSKKSEDEFCVYAAIGSERGWTDKERTLLEKEGYLRCGMGERIMRTETAATVAGSIILDRLEWL